MKVLGDLPCITCGKPVWWDRVGSSWRLMEGRGKHNCPGVHVVDVTPEPISNLCHAYMPHAGTVCARRRGHSMTGGHRSREIMDDEAQRRRSWRVAA